MKTEIGSTFPPFVITLETPHDVAEMFIILQNYLTPRTKVDHPLRHDMAAGLETELRNHFNKFKKVA